MGGFVFKHNSKSKEKLPPTTSIIRKHNASEGTLEMEVAVTDKKATKQDKDEKDYQLLLTGKLTLKNI